MVMENSAARGEGEVRETIWKIILDLAPSPVDAPSEQTRLVEDLGYHSLALLELAFALEDRFALPAMNEEQAQRISTMLDVEEYVLKQSGQGPGT